VKKTSHSMGCHSIQETRVKRALDDVTRIIRRALGGGEGGGGAGGGGAGTGGEAGGGHGGGGSGRGKAW